MPSTYSPNLRITLLATGEGAGTWGDTTNVNLGTLLEQAISGYEVQPLTSGSTLTLTIPDDGASAVARNMYLEFTGDGSTVIVPTNKKLYFVHNNCTSGTITMKVAGQTGVTIPQGAKQILVSNGTDVVEATSYITNVVNSLTVTNLSATSLTTSSLLATSLTTTNLSATSLTTTNLSATSLTTSSLLATSLTTTNLSATSLTVTNNASIAGIPFGKGISSGTANVVIGVNAGASQTNGGENVIVGTDAGDSITTGTGHTIVGDGAGSTLSTANFSTAVGLEAYLTGNFTNSTCLGFDAQVTGANQVQLGSSGTTTYVYGSVVDRASDIRDKADVQDTNLGLNFIMALRPVMYRWDYREDYRPPKPDQDASDEEWAEWREACKLSNLTHNGTHKRTRFHQGLIAQEVKAVMDSLGTDFGGYKDGTIDGGEDRVTLAYGELIAPLIKAIQELKAEFDEYKSTHP
jgi:uncharacterized protein YjbI with pentapeptide repeats